ncbi:importin-11 [Danio aesculapii]|uniref:importin-11 n=1 Tax=Danio aesculapii TaxID=1142201 RepID=UPI0024C0990D|nr:importin-11 [Danio aesculapii]
MDIQSASSVVLQALTQATSQDTAVLKPAEDQLRQWETQPGFYSVLLSIFNNHLLDVNVRWLAVLYFKNGIDRYWRRVAPHALSEEEKSSLRAGLITNFNEPVNQIATQIAVLIAKVARLDCPRQWPELIPILLESVKVQDSLQQHRALLTFYHVTKTLASKRLATDRRLFQDLASSIYSFACSLWNHHTDSFLQQIYTGDQQTALSSLERTLLSLKVLRKLTVHGFIDPQNNMEVMGFLNAVFERLKQFLECCPSNVEDPVQMLMKDAVYNAVGLAAYELFDNVDFDQWFKNQLLGELQVSHNRYKLIRRRVIWLIGQWISVKFKPELRPLLYEVILSLMQDPDLVVRIETATTLKLAVDDFEFRTEQFLPYLESIFSLLFQLLQQVNECDTKMQVLHVISCVIERVSVQIRPYVGCLVQYLPLLWKQSEEHNMLRCAILTTLIHLVQVWHTHGAKNETDNEPLKCSSRVFSILSVFWSAHLNVMCCTVSNRGLIFTIVIHGYEQMPSSPAEHISASLILAQDLYFSMIHFILFLLLVTLENSPAITPELLRIFQNMSPLLELSSENVRTCFQIINAYIYLSATDFLQNYAEALCRSFCELLSDITNEGQVQVLKVVEIAIKVSPILGSHMFQPLLPSVLRGIVEGERYPVVMSTYLGVTGRILLQNSGFFTSLLTQMAVEFNQEADQLLGSMIEMWVDRMDNITQPERRKLSALALLSLLPSDNSVIQDKFCGIINISVEALHDVMTEDPETATFKDCMLMSHFEEPKLTDDEEPPTEQDKRRKLLALEDPVHSVSLQQFVYEKLKAQQMLMGDQGFQALMETVDTEIVRQLQEFIQGM